MNLTFEAVRKGQPFFCHLKKDQISNLINKISWQSDFLKFENFEYYSSSLKC